MREGEGLQEGGRGGSALAGALWWLLWRMTGWESGPALPCLGGPPALSRGTGPALPRGTDPGLPEDGGRGAGLRARFMQKGPCAQGLQRLRQLGKLRPKEKRQHRGPSPELCHLRPSQTPELHKRFDPRQESPGEGCGGGSGNSTSSTQAPGLCSRGRGSPSPPLPSCHSRSVPHGPASVCQACNRAHPCTQPRCRRWHPLQ